jgi:hypothetical protein
MFKDCAAEWDLKIKTKLDACGNEIQEIVQVGRNNAVTARMGSRPRDWKNVKLKDLIPRMTDSPC